MVRAWDATPLGAIPVFHQGKGAGAVEVAGPGTAHGPHVVGGKRLNAAQRIGLKAGVWAGYCRPHSSVPMEETGAKRPYVACRYRAYDREAAEIFGKHVPLLAVPVERQCTVISLGRVVANGPNIVGGNRFHRRKEVDVLPWAGAGAGYDLPHRPIPMQDEDWGPVVGACLPYRPDSISRSRRDLDQPAPRAGHA